MPHGSLPQTIFSMQEACIQAYRQNQLKKTPKTLFNNTWQNAQNHMQEKTPNILDKAAIRKNNQYFS